MFKEAVSKLTSGISNSLDSALSDSDKPRGIAASVFSGIIDRGIMDLTHRSPILGNIAEHIYETKKISSQRKQDVNAYLGSGASEEHRTKFEESDMDSKDIDSKMSEILTKLSKSMDDVGERETKKTDLYKEYDKFFEDFKNSKNQKDTPKETAEGELAEISKNTKRTADSIDGLAGKTNTEPQKVEKITTVKAALNNAGGKLVNKVLDDSVIHNISESIKKIFASKKEVPVAETPDIGAAKPESVVVEKVKKESTPEKPYRTTAGGNKVTDDYSMFDKTPIKYGKLSDLGGHESVVAKPTQVKPESVVESIKKVKEKTLPKRDSKGRFVKSVPNVLSTVPEKIAEGESTLGKLASAAGVIRGVGAAASALSAAAPLALPVAGVLAAGAVGYGVGTLASTAIDSGISSATGRDNSLGGWLYDKFNDDPLKDLNKPTAGKSAVVLPKPVPNKTADISAMATKKEAISSTPAAESKPIVIQQSSSSGGSGSSTNIIAPRSVRNNESTFERVQMQDYWPRVA